MSGTIIPGLLGLLMVSAAGPIHGFSGFGFSIAAVLLLSLIFPSVQGVPLVMWIGWLSLAAAAIGLPAVWRCSWAGNRLFLRSVDGHYRRVALAILTVTVILAVARVMLNRFA